MATVNKNFKVKNGLVVEGTTATVNGNNILTETAGDSYILNLVGGVAYITSVGTNLSVTNGELSLDLAGIVEDIAGTRLTTDGSTLNVDVDGIADDLTGSYGFATTTDITTALSGYATESFVTGQGYLVSSDLSGYATESFVTGQGYLVSSDLSGYATESFVTTQGYLTSADLSGYATEAYVGSQGFATETYVGTEISTHAGLTSTHGVTGDIVGTTDTQDLSNKRFVDTLYFTDGVTVANEGEIAVRAVSHDFDVQANEGDLNLKTTALGSDVVVTATDGNILLEPAVGHHAYVGSASAGNEIATHSYVDNAISGLDWKQAVHLLYDAAIPTLSGSGATQLIIDGHPVLGDEDSGYRILLAAIGGASTDGIYVYNSTDGSWALTRAADADAHGELVGAAVYIMEGTQYGGSSWVQSNHYLTDFTGQDWTQFSGSGTVTAGDGITVNGLEVSVDRSEVDTWYDPAGAAAAITASSLGLGNVDNTSDLDKPISTATQSALDNKADAANPTLTGSLTLDGSGDFTITSDSNIVLDANTTAYLNAATAGNEIATEGYVDSAISNAAFDAAAAAGANLDWNGATNQFDVNVSDVITAGDIATNTSVGTDITTAIDALTTDSIEEGLSQYFTDSRAKDAAADLLTNASLTNITITGTGAGLTITAEDGIAGKTTDDLTEGSTNLYFTDQKALDAIDGQTITPLAVEINTYRKEEAAQQYVANASTVNIHSLPAGFESAKYLVRAVAVVNGTKHSQLTEILLTTDGMNNIAITEYGSICTDTNNLASFSADMVGLPAQPTLTATTAVAGCEIIAAATMLSWAD